MLAETIAYRNVYIICGYTDMRKSINGLVATLLLRCAFSYRKQLFNGLASECLRKSGGIHTPFSLRPAMRVCPVRHPDDLE